MAIPEGKQRITITVSDESVDKLAMYGKKMGMNRSALCAYLVGQGLMGLDRANAMFDRVADSVSDEMRKALAEMSAKAGDGGAK